MPEQTLYFSRVLRSISLDYYLIHSDPLGIADAALYRLL